MFGRGRLSTSAEEKDPEPDLSPMIDCVFILLIFFIVTAVFVEEDGLPLNRPEESSAVSAVENKSVVLIVQKDNAVYHDGKRIGVQGVGAIVRQGLAKDSQAPIIIQSADLAAHGVRVAVQNQAISAGASPAQVTMTSL